MLDNRNYLKAISNIFIIAAFYVLSYGLWRVLILSPSTALSDLGSLFFIPHGVRILSAILFGWLGVVGTLVGEIYAPHITLDNPEASSIYDAGESLVGALSPMLAILILRWTGLWSPSLKTHQLFKKLNIKLLILIIFISSAINALLSNLITALNGEVSVRSPMTIFNFLVGDIAGAFFIMSLALIVMTRFNSYKK